jgi:hypothetical protein
VLPRQQIALTTQRFIPLNVGDNYKYIHMKHSLKYLTFLTSFLYCCEKNIDNTVTSNEIIAGKYDTLTMEYFDFNPDWVLPFDEIGCHQYVGIDSINIDQNSNWDLKLKYYLYNDIFGECCTDTIYDCFGSLYLNKTIQIPDNFQIHTDTLNWVKPLNNGDIIDSKLNWCDDTTVLLFSQGAVTDPGDGYWYWTNMTEAKYIGIRKIETHDTIYGWLLVDAKSNIIIKEYAFNQKFVK